MRRKPQRVQGCRLELIEHAPRCRLQDKRLRQIAGKGRQAPALRLYVVLDLHQHGVVADDLRNGNVDKRGERRFLGLLLRGVEFARRDIRPGERIAAVQFADAGDEVVAPLVELTFLGHRPRGDDADDVALDHLARTRLGKLLTDRDALPHRNEFGDIAVCRVIGNAAHRRALLESAVSAR